MPTYSNDAYGRQEKGGLLSDEDKQMVRTVGKWVGIGATVLIGATGFFTSFYTVPTGSVGVETRFGQYRQMTGAGPHFRLPFGIDGVDKISTQNIRTVEVGYYIDDRQEDPFVGWDQDEAMAEEAKMLTGDENIVLVDGTVQYRVIDPLEWLFNVENPEETLDAASHAAFRQVVGNHGVDEVLTFGRGEIQTEITGTLQELVDEYGLGVSIINVQLSETGAPPQVSGAFRDVQTAKEERETAINQAETYRNTRIPAARGEASAAISGAEQYHTTRVNEATGNAARFLALLAEFKDAPEVTRQRLYLEMVETVFPNIDWVIVDPELADGQMLQFLDLTPGTEQGGE